MFANGDGSLTVSNTTQDASYSIYKVFDATYSGESVSYTYTKKGDSDAFFTALTGSDSPFTLTQIQSTNQYTVVKKATSADADVLTFIKGQGPTYNSTSKTWSGGNLGSAITTLSGNGSSITFSNLDYGYYFVTSTVGSLVTIDSALKDVTVIDKNQEITLDKQEKVANGTWVYEGPYNDSTTPPTANVGDTVNYKVTGVWTRYQGEDVVKTLKWHDVMSSGLTAKQDVEVKFGNTVLTKVDSNPGQNQYTVTYTLNNNNTADDTADDYWVTEIIVPVATIPATGDPTFFYNVTNNYEITYSATIDKDAIIDGEEENTVDLKYTDKNDTEKEVGNDKTKVNDYPVHLLKYDGKNTDATTDDTALAGAKFKLYAKTEGQADSTTAIKVVLVSGIGDATSTTDNVYRLAEAGETGATVIEEMVVGTTGKITVKGLANGKYHFEEIEAPAGFNKLTARTDVATVTDNEATITAINNSGSVLPSTGGSGTTMLYIIGAILLAGAGILLVTRRRMKAE